MRRVFSCGTAWAAIEIILQNDHGCNFVDMLPPFSPVETHFFEVLLSGKARKTFIPKYNRDAQRFLNLTGEAGHFLALWALLAVHVQRLANDDFVHFIFGNKSAKNIDIGVKTFSSNRRPGLCCEKERVTYGNTDGFIADIETHNPHIFMIPPPVRRAYNKREAVPSSDGANYTDAGRPQF